MYYSVCINCRIIQLNDAGLLDKLKKRYLPKHIPCPLEDSSAPSIETQNVAGILYVTMGMLVFAASVLLIEILIYYHRRINLG